MIGDPLYEEFMKYGRPATVEDVYTPDKVQEMKDELKRGNLYILKEGKLVLQNKEGKQ